jgi:large subunit ribosomal protein L10
MDRAQKQVEIDNLSQRFAKAQLALCADYRGITVGEVTVLRRNLRKAGATARVVKNKLAKRSVDATLSGSDKSTFLDVFKGPTFVVISDSDPVGPAKVIAEFAKQNSKFTIKGAWVDGGFLDAARVEALSKMPGKQELLAQLLSLINTPATRLVGLLQAPGAQVVRLLEAQRKKIEGVAS